MADPILFDTSDGVGAPIVATHADDAAFRRAAEDAANLLNDGD